MKAFPQKRLKEELAHQKKKKNEVSKATRVGVVSKESICRQNN